MPRGPRLDYPGALHHVIARGIERRKIFLTDRDRLEFLERLGQLIIESKAALYAWSLMPNHGHALIRTGEIGLSRLVQRWLGPYVTAFNLVHRRAGHLFQNRFKNILVEEDPYFLELVRYIHLNPVRSRLPVTLESLDRYRWTGHAVLLGHGEFLAQDCAFVLQHFGNNVRTARHAYREFVHEGACSKNVPDFEGGGLCRSAGGWQMLQRLKSGRERWVSDERILGNPEFVREVLGRANEEPVIVKPEDPQSLLQDLCQKIAARFGVTAEELATPSLRRPVLAARAVVSQIAVTHHGLSLTTTARHLNVSKQSIARGLERAPQIFAEYGLTIADFLIA